MWQTQNHVGSKQKVVSASKAGAEVVLHSYTEQDSHMQEHHVEWSSRTAESAHLLFPEMEITVFFLDLLKSFNCCWIKAPVLTVLFQIPATLFLHWRLHSCGAALHVFTDIIFFLQLFHAATTTPQNKSTDSTTGFCLLYSFCIGITSQIVTELVCHCWMRKRGESGLLCISRAPSCGLQIVSFPLTCFFHAFSLHGCPETGNKWEYHITPSDLQYYRYRL